MRPLFLIFIVRGAGIKLLERLIIITCLESVAAGGGAQGMMCRGKGREVKGRTGIGKRGGGDGGGGERGKEEAG